MAITKKIFDQSSSANNRTDVIAWLQVNGEPYFDSVSNDGECTLDGHVVAKFGENGDWYLTKYYLANGTEVWDNRNGALYTTGYVTDYGLVLQYMRNGECLQEVYIARTNDDSTAILFSLFDYDIKASFADVLKNTAWQDKRYTGSEYITNGMAALDSMVNDAPMTALTPLVFTGGSYTPHLFVETFTEYKGVVGRKMMLGTAYVSDGYVSLEE